MENPLNNIKSFKLKNLSKEEDSNLVEHNSIDMSDSHFYKNIQEANGDISKDELTVVTSRPLSINKSFSKEDSKSPQKLKSKDIKYNNKRFGTDDDDKMYTYSQLNPGLESLINQVRKVLPSDSYSKTDETASKNYIAQKAYTSDLLSSLSRNYKTNNTADKNSIKNYHQMRTKSAGNQSYKNPRMYYFNTSGLPNPCCLNLYEQVRHFRGVTCLQKPIKHRIFLQLLYSFTKIKFTNTQISEKLGIFFCVYNLLMQIYFIFI